MQQTALMSKTKTRGNWSTLGLLAATLLATILLSTGCGGKKSASTEPQEPGAALDALADAAARGQIDRLMNMMTSQARTQTGAQWINYLRRTGSVVALRGFEKLTPQQQGEAARLQTKALFELLHKEAPLFFARFFSVGYVAHAEQDNKLLVLVTGQSGSPAYLSMQRDSGGNLLLASEAESAEIQRQLASQLNARLQEIQKQAADEARRQAEEAQ